ncbi:MAG: DNA repair protein RecO [Bacillota bacterium]|nr:DNA repair protein RecO [Bacillota bacterium]
MKPYTVEAIVLRSKPLDGADKLLVLFSRERGRLRALAYGAGKPASRKRGAVQPFSRASILLDEGRELDVVRQAQEIEGMPHLHEDLEAMAFAAYFAELVESFSPEQEPNEPLFAAFLAALRGLGRAGDRGLLALAFTARVLALAGLAPLLDACAGCGAPPAADVAFSLGAGGVLCRACRGTDPGARDLPPGTLRILEHLFTWPLEHVSRLRPGAETRRELAALLLSQVRFHLEREPKSLSFLRQLGAL